MWQRCLTAIVGIPLAFFLVHLGGISYFFAVSILSILGMHEFFRILIPYDIGILRYWAYFCGIAWQTAVFFQAEFIPLLLLVFLFIGVFSYIINFKKLKLQDFSLTILGVVYVFGLFNYLILLRFFVPQGKWWVYLALVLIWSNDTGAFFTGRYLGRHNLHKIVSPKKTIEGALGGIVLTTCISFVCNSIFRYMSFSEAIVFGILVSALGIIGDLWESGLKRVGAVKDSGSLLPGHGGVLDRFDSLLFAAPVIYYFVLGLIFH